MPTICTGSPVSPRSRSVLPSASCVGQYRLDMVSLIMAGWHRVAIDSQRNGSPVCRERDELGQTNRLYTGKACGALSELVIVPPRLRLVVLDEAGIERHREDMI